MEDLTERKDPPLIIINVEDCTRDPETPATPQMAIIPAIEGKDGFTLNRESGEAAADFLIRARKAAQEQTQEQPLIDEVTR